MSLNENTSKAEWHLITFQFIKSNQHQLVYIYQISKKFSVWTFKKVTDLGK